MSSYSIGAMNQLGDALQKVGFTNEQITALRSDSDRLEMLRFVIEGKAGFFLNLHTVNLSVFPTLPKKWDKRQMSAQDQHDAPVWSIREHFMGDEEFILPSSRLCLINIKQSSPDFLRQIGELKAEIKDSVLANSILLDYLLEHPWLIPSDWKGKRVIFFGTEYKEYVSVDLSSSTSCYYRCLWYSEKDCAWGWSDCELIEGCSENDYALVISE